MSKSNHKRFVSKKQYLDDKRDLVREANVEHSEVRLDGVGEHPAIQAAASPEFATMSNSAAAEIALQLQQLVRGNASILQNQEMLSSEIGQLKAKMNKYDEDAQKWETDRVKFMEEVNDRANKLRVTDPAQRGVISAKVMAEAAEAEAMARAMYQTNKLKFKEKIANSPKVMIISPGVIESGRIGDQMINRVVPEVIRIKNYQWKLPPGVAVEVPDFVAKRYAEIQRSRAELEERKMALSADRNNGEMSSAVEVNQAMAKINDKYGTTPEVVA